MKLFSKIISFLFHPMLMPTLGVFLILNSGTHLSYMPFEIRRLVYIIVFVSSCLLPISLLPLFLQLKLIRSFNMKTARERVFPALSVAFFYLLGYFLLNRLNISQVLEMFVLTSVVAVLIAVGISRFWKISLHSIAVGGVTGALAALMLRSGADLFWIIALMIFISGLIAMARLYLNAHSPAQVYIGYAIGSLVVFAGIVFM